MIPEVHSKEYRQGFCDGLARGLHMDVRQEVADKYLNGLISLEAVVDSICDGAHFVELVGIDVWRCLRCRQAFPVNHPATTMSGRDTTN